MWYGKKKHQGGFWLTRIAATACGTCFLVDVCMYSATITCETDLRGFCWGVLPFQQASSKSCWPRVVKESSKPSQPPPLPDTSLESDCRAPHERYLSKWWEANGVNGQALFLMYVFIYIYYIYSICTVCKYVYHWPSYSTKPPRLRIVRDENLVQAIPEFNGWRAPKWWALEKKKPPALNMEPVLSIFGIYVFNFSGLRLKKTGQEVGWLQS